MRVLEHGREYQPKAPERPSHAGATGRCEGCGCRFELAESDPAEWAQLSGYRGVVWGFVAACPECSADVGCLPLRPEGFQVAQARIFAREAREKKGGAR